MTIFYPRYFRREILKFQHTEKIIHSNNILYPCIKNTIRIKKKIYIYIELRINLKKTSSKEKNEMKERKKEKRIGNLFN